MQMLKDTGIGLQMAQLGMAASAAVISDSFFYLHTLICIIGCTSFDSLSLSSREFTWGGCCCEWCIDISLSSSPLEFW